MSEDREPPRVRVAFSLFRFAVTRERHGRVYFYVSRPFRAPSDRPGAAEGLLRGELRGFDTKPPYIVPHDSTPAGSGMVWRSPAVSL